MKIRKVLVICGLLISVTASTFNVSAATARAAKDCTGTITLAKTSGTFKVTEITLLQIQSLRKKLMVVIHL